MAQHTEDGEFPYSIIILLPLPNNRLAHAAFRSLQVDAELSPLVKRSFSLTSNSRDLLSSNKTVINGSDRSVRANGTSVIAAGAVADEDPEINGHVVTEGSQDLAERLTVLKTEYRAATNRMLRVAVNGFMESLGVVLGVMEHLDVDVLAEMG